MILKISRYDTPEIPRFMVGDMKQSIYRFRNADLDIFNEKYLTYGKYDNNKRIDLVFNYRSGKIVLDSINYMFNAIMDSNVGGLEYYRDKYASLNYDFLRKDKCIDDTLKEEANLVLDNEQRFDTEVMLMLKTEENSKELVESEAMMIAEKIQNMVGQLDLDFYYGTKKANYQDIVVLSRNVGNFITYKKVFQKANIPSLIVLTKGFFESNEIIACISFLQAINNALDDVAFVSFLKGHYVFSHKSESWIYQHKKEDMSMYESLLECDEEGVQQLLALYHDYCEFAAHHPVYELLEKFLADSQYEIFVSSLYNGKQRYANIQLFIEILKNDADLSLYQIVENINQTIDLGIEYKPAILPNDGNAVVFMTIHQSKGLEFPIVFVNQLNHQFNFDDSKQSLVYDKNLGIISHVNLTLTLGDFKNILVEYKNPIHGLFAESLTKETINEEMRILYVALTRASQKLILTGTVKNLSQLETWQRTIVDDCLWAKTPVLPKTIRKTNNMLDWVMLSIMKHPHIVAQMKDKSCFSESIFNSEDLTIFHLNTLNLSLNTHILNAANIRHAKYSLYIQTKYDLHMSSLKTTDDIDMNIYKQNKQKQIESTNTRDKTAAVTSLISDGDRTFIDHSDNDETVKATDRGTIIHSILEHLSLNCTNLEEELTMLYQSSLYDDTQKTVIEGYKEHIQKFLESDVYRLMQNSSHCFKEKEFSFVEDNGQIIHGIFDVLCFLDNQITIIDYKTDRVSQETPEDVLIELHYQQMEYYKKILRRIFPQSDIQAIVYYLHIDQYVTF